MIYEIQNENITYTYKYTYKREKLEKILEELKKHKRTFKEKGEIGGSILETVFFKNQLIKRIEPYVTSKNIIKTNKKLIPESVIHHKDKERNFCTYEYYYDKLPNLYHFIDLIINGKYILDYDSILSYKNSKVNLFDSITNRNQIIMENLMNYINSEELQNSSYDSNELKRLYEETLKCFDFELIAIKEHLENQEPISGIILQRK